MYVARRAAYLRACTRIAEELSTDPFASRFKSEPIYAAVVGNDTRDAATTEVFLRWHLLCGITLTELYRRVALNDAIGQPRLHTLEGLPWSTASLRYAQVALELVGFTAVVEVGGGYGGQRVLAPWVVDYHIVDLPEALEVQGAYLGHLGLSFGPHTPDALPMVWPGAFFLSDFALSEFEPAIAERYFAVLAARCAAGRITAADDRAAWIAELARAAFEAVDVSPESPASSSRHANSVIRFTGRRA